MRLKNKKIVVTAAAQGIGKSTALKFASEGASVIATDINEQKLNVIKNENGSIDTQKLDATNKEEVHNFVLVLGILMSYFMQLVLFTMVLSWIVIEEFTRSVNVNIYSAYLMSYNLLPKMLNKEKEI